MTNVGWGRGIWSQRNKPLTKKYGESVWCLGDMIPGEGGEGGFFDPGGKKTDDNMVCFEGNG